MVIWQVNSCPPPAPPIHCLALYMSLMAKIGSPSCLDLFSYCFQATLCDLAPSTITIWPPFGLDRPLSSFGTLVGNNISRKIKKKIWNHKFIELNCLLPHVTEEEDNHTTAVASGHDRSLKLVKPKRQTILSIWQWLEAWEVFMAIYTQKSSHRRHIQALLTYSRDIRNMSKLNYDWLGFDREFRIDRESTKCSWATVRHDLHLTYGQPRHPTPRQPTPSFQKPEYTQQQQPFLHHSNVRNHPLYTAQGHAIPRGYCIRFHSREVICEKGTECTYLHKCPTCNRRHPIFDKCHTHRQRLGFNTQNKPSHAESRPDNNHNRPHKKLSSQASVRVNRLHDLLQFYDPVTTQYLVDGFTHGFDLGDDSEIIDTLPKNSS